MSPAQKPTPEQIQQDALNNLTSVLGQLQQQGGDDPYSQALSRFSTLPPGFKRPGTPARGIFGTTFNPLATVGQIANQALTGQPITRTYQTIPGSIIGAVGETVGAALTGETPDYTVSDDGMMLLYSNGAIADLATGQVIIKPTDANAEGSEAWLRDIQESWSDAQVKKWRKKLSRQGYEVAEDGDMAADLINGLRQYHYTRYLNFGKPLRQAPSGRAGEPKIRDMIDRVALKEEVKGWGEVPFGEGLGGNEAEYFAERVIEVAERLARKHTDWSPEQAVAGAQTRVQKQFIKAPEVADALEDIEEEEMDTSLEESLYSAAQIASL